MEQKEMLSFNEASAFAGISKSYLYKLTSSRRIPHYKPTGKLIFFNRRELQDWLQKNKISSIDEIEAKAQSYCLQVKKGGVR